MFGREGGLVKAVFEPVILLPQPSKLLGLLSCSTV